MSMTVYKCTVLIQLTAHVETSSARQAHSLLGELRGKEAVISMFGEMPVGVRLNDTGVFCGPTNVNTVERDDDH